VTVKHRDTLFAVVRDLKAYGEWSSSVVAVTTSLDRAEELCGVYLQELKDRLGESPNVEILFSVQPVTYYDE
jgi:hypothetical protein